MLLTGCSSGKHVVETLDKPVLVERSVVHPRKPAPVKLKDETFRVDENGNVVMTPEEFGTILENKINLGRWMASMNNIVDYYRALFPASPPRPLPKPQAEESK